MLVINNYYQLKVPTTTTIVNELFSVMVLVKAFLGVGTLYNQHTVDLQ